MKDDNRSHSGQPSTTLSKKFKFRDEAARRAAIGIRTGTRLVSPAPEFDHILWYSKCMTCGTGMLPESLVDWVTGPGAVQVHFGPDLVLAWSRTTRHLHLISNSGFWAIAPYSKGLFGHSTHPDGIACHSIVAVCSILW